ncbi:hypothetical protein TrVFT333_000920 [Trichoderma virens FT-333]|nr:hypothetical protein TrVFT333_000920 [Trichoderma virens FT-333]
MTTVRLPPEEVVDGEIQLRRWRSDDVDTLHALVNRSLPELSPWMPWAANGYSKEDAVEAIRLGSEGWDAGEEFEYAIVVDGQVRGSCRIVKRGGPGVFELGYWLGSGETGRGLATRASALLVGIAFDQGADCVEPMGVRLLGRKPVLTKAVQQDVAYLSIILSRTPALSPLIQPTMCRILITTTTYAGCPDTCNTHSGPVITENCQKYTETGVECTEADCTVEYAGQSKSKGQCEKHRDKATVTTTLVEGA